MSSRFYVTSALVWLKNFFDYIEFLRIPDFVVEAANKTLNVVTHDFAEIYTAIKTSTTN